MNTIDEYKAALAKSIVRNDKVMSDKIANKIRELEAAPAPAPTPTPTPAPAPAPEQQDLLNVIPKREQRPMPIAGRQNLFSEAANAGIDAVEGVVGGLDAGQAFGRDIAGSLGSALYQMQQGFAKKLGLYDGKALNVHDELLLKGAEDVKKFLTAEVFTEEGQEFKSALSEYMMSNIQGTPIEDGMNFIGEKAEEFKEFLTDATGSEVYANAILGGGELGAAALGASLATKGYKVGKDATFRDVRETAIRLDNNVFNVDKMKELTDIAYKELGNVDVNQGTFTKAINYAANNMPESDVAGISSFIETELKKLNTANKIRLKKFGSNYNERFSDITNFQRALETRAQSIGNGNEAYALNNMAQNLDTFMFDTNFIDFKKFGYSDIGRDNAKKLKANAQRLSGQVIRTRQIRNALNNAASSTGRAVKNYQTEMEKILKDPSKNRFYTLREREIMKDIVGGAPLRADGKLPDEKVTGERYDKRDAAMQKSDARREESSNYVRSFGAFANEGDGNLVFIAKLGRAVNTTFRQVASVQPARFIEGLFKRRKQNFGKAYTSLANQVLAGKNGQEIIMRYLKAVPIKKRDMKELGELLAMGDIDLQNIKVEKLTSKIQKESVEYARGLRVLGAAFGQEAATLGSPPQDEEEEENKRNTPSYNERYMQLERQMR